MSSGTATTTRSPTPPLAKSPRLRRIQWIAVAFLTAAGIINYVDRSALSIANTAIRDEMALSPAQMGWLLSAFSLAYAFSQLPVGALLDRIGSRIMLGAGMFFWSLAQLVSGFVANFQQFVIARAVLGLGEAPQFPAGAKTVSEWFSVRERGTPTGIFVASSCIGPCIAPPLLTAMMLSLGWRWMFVVTGLVGIVVAVGWYLVYRNRAEVALTRDEVAHLDEGAAPEPPARRMTFSEWRGLFAHATTWGMILGFMGVIYMVWLYLTWLPSYLEHERGLSVARTGWVVAIPYVFGTLGMLCAGQAADRLLARGAGIVASRKWPVCVGLLGGGAFTVPAAYTPSVTLAVVYICLAMFFINMASGAAWMMVSVAVPKRQVASLGSIQNFGGYFAGSFAPVITGYIVQGTGSYVNALLAAAAVAVLAAAAYIVLVRKPLEGSETLIPTERTA
ncbi:Sugar phosphate permease [Methylobacterium sp. 174MFSha1.1]|uniref:MFS transporter n=1 Tax=Methylobacterium sp. 174MFSha1.1 TaxID=1502749 RepID=UPI0008E28AF2|nr:MFS transporter [Methylobacterium sp. 174MFSha1.1]SFV12461.1 Sugar phosphate permease [Methylobacterium sp. 174MFSha1.1]